MLKLYIAGNLGAATSEAILVDPLKVTAGLTTGIVEIFDKHCDVMGNILNNSLEFTFSKENKTAEACATNGSAATTTTRRRTGTEDVVNWTKGFIGNPIVFVTSWWRGATSTTARFRVIIRTRVRLSVRSRVSFRHRARARTKIRRFRLQFT